MGFKGKVIKETEGYNKTMREGRNIALPHCLIDE